MSISVQMCRTSLHRLVGGGAISFDPVETTSSGVVCPATSRFSNIFLSISLWTQKRYLSYAFWPWIRMPETHAAAAGRWQQQTRTTPVGFVGDLTKDLFVRGQAALGVNEKSRGFFAMKLRTEDALDTDRPTVLIRSFDLDASTAKHDYVRAGSDARGTGAMDEFLANCVKFYDQLGIRYVILNAGLSRGGYKWAKLGWQPISDREWDRLRFAIQKTYRPGYRYDVSAQVRQDVDDLLSSRDKSSLTRLAWIQAGVGTYPREDGTEGVITLSKSRSEKLTNLCRDL